MVRVPVVVVSLVFCSSAFFCFLRDDRIRGGGSRIGGGGGFIFSVVSKMVESRGKGASAPEAYEKRVYYNCHNLNNNKMPLNTTLVVRVEW